jgi:N-acyl amino acid synthase of PEP-CTERM/exosortase system
MSISDVQVVVADTAASRRIHYNLRYQVFCLETGFEEASRYPDEQETDEFDAYSTAFLVRQNGSNVWAGTARLILPDDKLLPIQHMYQLSNTLSLKQTGEVSRLLIIGDVRRRSAAIKQLLFCNFQFTPSG